MATSVSPVHGPAARSSKEPSKAEYFVESQIQRARQRVRLSELGKAGLGCLILIAGYSVVLAYLDRWLQLSSFSRQLLFACCCLALATYVGWSVVWPFFQRINPYYAARLVEQNLEADKNSLINWLDLHEQPLVPAFRTAITNQAARDLGKVDLERAIAAKPNLYALIIGGTLLALLLLLFASSPRQFLSLMGRAWAPFTEATIATRTRLTLVEPPDGDLTVAIGKAVTIDVQVDGRIPDQQKPDSLRVLYRTGPADPFETRLLDPTDDPHRWHTTFLPAELKTGFGYKVAGGDAETPEYHVQVRSNPLLTSVDAVYHYRPYLHWPDRTAQDPNLKDLRGTEVALTVHTNRTVREGRLLIEGQKPLLGAVHQADPEALHFQVILEKDTQYRVFFTSIEGESNHDPMSYSIQVLTDQPPLVVLTRPGRDVELGVNEVLPLEGQASDDLGLAAMTLRLRKQDGKLLEPQPYRQGKSLLRGDGRPPQMLEYKDSVDLAKLREPGGTAYKPQVGQAIEYWLEAADHCDYPGPNLGSSKHYKVAFRDPVDPKKQQSQREKAAQEQKAHDQNQDQKLQEQHDQGKGDKSPQDQKNGQGDDQQKEGGGKGRDHQKGEDGKSAEQQKGDNGQAGDHQKGEDGKSAEQQKGDNGQAGDQQKGEDGKSAEQQKGDKGPPGDQQKGEAGKSAEQQKTDKGQAGDQQKGDKGQAGDQQKGDKGQAGDQQKGEAGKPAEQQRSDKSRSDEEKLEQQMKKLQQALDKTQKNKGDGQKNREQKSGADKKQGTEGGQSGAQNQVQQKPDPSGSGDKGTNPNQPNKPPDAKGSNPTGQDKEENKDKGDPAKSSESASPKKDSGMNPADKQGKDDTNPKGSQEKQPGAQSKDVAGSNKEKNPAKPGDSKEKEKSQQGSSAGKNQGKDAEKSDQRTDKGAAAGTDGDHKPADPKQDATGAERQKGGDTAKPAGPGKPSTEKPKTDGSSSSPEKGHDPARGGETKPTGQSPGQAKPPEQNQGKPDGRKNPGDKADPGMNKTGKETKQDKQVTPDAQKAREALEKLQKDLRSSDAKTRADAEKKLEEIRKLAQDPDVRKAAEAMKAAADKEQQKGSPGSEQGKGRDSQSPDKKTGTEKGDKGEGGAKDKTSDHGKSTKKPGNPNEDKGQENPEKGQGDARDKPSDQGKATDKPDGTNEGKGRSDPKTPGDQGPKQPGVGDARAKAPSKPGDVAPPKKGQAADGQGERPDSPPSPPEPPDSKQFGKQAGDLVLDKIKKNVNDDVLKEAKMTPEEYQQFLKAYKNMLDKDRLKRAEKENLPSPSKGGAAQPNRGLHQVETMADPKISAERGGPALAPLEFRDAQSKFSRRLSELGASPDKK